MDVLFYSPYEALGLGAEVAFASCPQFKLKLFTTTLNEAIEAIDKQRFDVVFTDIIRVDGRSGIELLVAIKKAGSSAVPIVYYEDFSEASFIVGAGPEIEIAQRRGAAMFEANMLEARRLGVELFFDRRMGLSELFVALEQRFKVNG